MEDFLLSEIRTLRLRQVITFRDQGFNWLYSVRALGLLYAIELDQRYRRSMRQSNSCKPRKRQTTETLVRSCVSPIMQVVSVALTCRGLGLLVELKDPAYYASLGLAIEPSLLNSLRAFNYSLAVQLIVCTLLLRLSLTCRNRNRPASSYRASSLLLCSGSDHSAT